jgi:hypothetical protein
MNQTVTGQALVGVGQAFQLCPADYQRSRVSRKGVLPIEPEKRAFMLSRVLRPEPKASASQTLPSATVFSTDNLNGQAPTPSSFNRLRPYSTLDDYLPEVERTWRVSRTRWASLVRRIRPLINRILLPCRKGASSRRISKIRTALPKTRN